MGFFKKLINGTTNSGASYFQSPIAPRLSAEALKGLRIADNPQPLGWGTHNDFHDFSGIVYFMSNRAVGRTNSNSASSRKSIQTAQTLKKDNDRLNHTVPELIKMDILRHRNGVMIAGAIIFTAMFFLYSSYFKAAFVLAALISMGVVSRVWQRIIPLEFGIELVLLATVVSALAYGAFAGAVVGLLSLSISTLFTQENPGKMWPSFVIIAVIGFLATALPITNIALLGLVLTVIYDALISIVYVGFMGARIINTLIFCVTHIAFNYFVFYHIAPALLLMIV